MNTQHTRTLGRTVLLALAAAAIAQACGKDSNPDPGAPVITGGSSGSEGTGGRGGSGNRGGTSGTGNEGGETSGGTSGTSGSGGTTGGSSNGGSGNRGGSGGTGNDGGTGNEGGDGPTDCVESPTRPEDFLNRCTDSRCAPFDNFARIPGYDGTLPDL
ncbi:MAG TPA: hypothetical protein VFZ53_12000 [Polyangiaceae bacterium]